MKTADRILNCVLALMVIGAIVWGVQTLTVRSERSRPAATSNQATPSAQADYSRQNQDGERSTADRFSEHSAIALAEACVPGKLKCPSTAKFPGSYIYDSNIRVSGKPVYPVIVPVDAQNSYGAMIRDYFIVIVFPGRSDPNSWSPDLACPSLQSMHPMNLHEAVTYALMHFGKEDPDFPLGKVIETKTGQILWAK